MIFYTADLHLGHKNVIRLCDRPFANVEEMDATLIANWNAVVGAEDIVYVLGDFSFRSAGSVKPVLKALNGTKHLILGNHDKSWMKNVRAEEYFASVSPLLEIDDGDTHITLCHYPMLSWNRVMHGAIHIHGHIHNNTNYSFGLLEKMSAYNAGVDVNGFKPVTLEQLINNKAAFYSQVAEKDMANKIASMTEKDVASITENAAAKKIADALKPLAEHMSFLCRQAISHYTPIAERIIRGEISDEKEIDLTLTYMLDHCYDKEMFALFKRVCRALLYKYPELVHFYIHEYKYMWDSDGDADDETDETE